MAFPTCWPAVQEETSMVEATCEASLVEQCEQLRAVPEMVQPPHEPL